MEKYFSVSRPLPQVFRLADPRGVFLTLIVGRERAFLADTGMGVGNLSAALARLTDRPVTPANTHGHIDHTGGNYQFERVWLAGADRPLVKEWLAPERKKRVLALSETPLPPDFDRRGYLDYGGENLEELKDGQRFDLGGLTVEAVALPTHTKGSMGFLCPELGLLLTGDSLSTVTYLVMEESCTVPEYIRQLEGLRELPFTRMLSAHEPGLMERECLEAFLACARQVEPEKTVRFRNPLFPERPGRMFVYEAPCCPQGYAALIYAPEKLREP